MSRNSRPIRNRLRAPDIRPSASSEQLADANGNRSERRAWAKYAKRKGINPPGEPATVAEPVVALVRPDQSKETN